MHLRTELFWILWVIAFLVMPTGFTQDPSNFSGEWNFNSGKSDDLRKLLEKSLEKFNPAGLRLVQTPRGVVAMGDYIEKPTEEKIEAIYGYLNSITPFDEMVSIHHDEPLLRLTYKDGRQRDVYTDERDSSTVVQSAAAQQDQKLVFAGWDKTKEKIVIETNANSGTTIIETLTLLDVNKPEKLRLKYEFKIESIRLSKFHEIIYYYQPKINNDTSNK